MSNELKTSINLLCYILGGNQEPTINAIADLYEIQNGNKKIILKHLKAIHKIFGKAIDELEGVDKE